MIDLHCHILPGLDDGPATWQESLAMARLAAADGVEVIVATPHCNLEGACPAPDEICALTEKLNQRLAAENQSLRLVPGAEARAAPDLVEAVTHRRVLTLADRGKYLLVELPPSGAALFAEELFFRLQLAGVTPIIAHAERYDYFRMFPQVLEEMAARGYPVQVNAGSFIGQDGGPVRRRALRLVQQGLATVIASDGHDARDRPPLLSVAERPLRLGHDSFLKYVRDRPFRILGQQRARKPDA